VASERLSNGGVHGDSLADERAAYSRISKKRTAAKCIAEAERVLATSMERPIVESSHSIFRTREVILLDLVEAAACRSGDGGDSDARRERRLR
jgi:hypothetical protein